MIRSPVIYARFIHITREKLGKVLIITVFGRVVKQDVERVYKQRLKINQNRKEIGLEFAFLSATKKEAA